MLDIRGSFVLKGGAQPIGGARGDSLRPVRHPGDRNFGEEAVELVGKGPPVAWLKAFGPPVSMPALRSSSMKLRMVSRSRMVAVVYISPRGLSAGAFFDDQYGERDVGGDDKIACGHLIDDMGISNVKAMRDLNGADELRWRRRSIWLATSVVGI